MRMSVSPKSGLPVARVLAAALLASVVTGCSSDATRFSSIFTNDDTLVTNSVQKRQITGLNNGAPIPGADVSRSGVVQPDYSNRQQALNQPYPAAPSQAGASPARMAAAPVSVQRNTLSAPQSDDRNVAMAQPFPTARSNATRVDPDMVTTGSNANSTGNRLSASAPQRVTLARGESIATLSRRYGISEQEILKANGMPNSASAIIGQEIIIPGHGPQSNAARASADGVRLQDQGNVPVPKRQPEQRVAVLPGTTQLRDKSQIAATPNSKATTGQGKPQPDTAATYEVKPGDSLSKVARTTGVSIDALKAANGLSSGGIRIGQKLKLPTGAAGATETLKTASVPQAAKPEAKTQPVAAYKPPVATQTVTEVSAIADPKEVAPEATGIGKYRWPVRGAVVAGYGANVDGKRNDGIDISVPSGTPIKAAENGVVIYAGNGLKELGNTVLVRHDDGTVTVYGHADALSVARGQKVQRGQTVATSGMSGNIKRPMLHFEVRKNATPVNPMTFLE
ncbi:MAG: peptidoglycan DD-metalloendopeptidase family protein [Allorhizobium sp.]